MRRRHPVLILSLLAALAIAVAGCGTGGSSESSIDLSSAAAATTSAKTAKVAFDMKMTSSALGGKTFSIPGDGALALKGHKGELNLDMGSIAQAAGQDPSGFKAKEIIDGLTLYMQFPFLASKLPAGVKWIKLDLAKAGDKMGINFGSLASGSGGLDPSQYLTQLKATSGSVEKKGTATVRGVKTTHYHAVVDYSKLPDTLPPSQRAAARQSIKQVEKLTGLSHAPIDVWLDSGKRVRRMAMTIDVKPKTGAQAGQSQHIKLKMDFYDYGTPVNITPPPASETKDLTSFVPSTGTTP